MTPQVLNKPIPVQYHDGNLKILVKLPLKNGEKFDIEIVRLKKISQKKIDQESFKKILDRSFGILKDENWTKLRKSFNKDINSRTNKLWHVSS